MDCGIPEEYAHEPRFWWERAEYYRLEHEKLDEEDLHRASRSVTPQFAYPPIWPGNTELDHAKCSAGNIARQLADFPAGKALLEAEFHGSSTKDGDPWWAWENFQKPPSETKDHGDFTADPNYWWNKKKLYGDLLYAERVRTKLQRVKRSADRTARDLATFPAGKALLEAEDHGDSVGDPEYWLGKKKYYEAKYDELKEEF